VDCGDLGGGSAGGVRRAFVCGPCSASVSADLGARHMKNRSDRRSIIKPRHRNADRENPYILYTSQEESGLSGLSEYSCR
jgi:hypothetical protein